jgi:hypothetical protein
VTYAVLRNRSGLFLNPLVGFLRPNFGTQFGVRGHVRAFESGDMSPHSKPSAADAAKLARPGQFPDLLASAILHELQQFDGLMADRSRTRRVL